MKRILFVLLLLTAASSANAWAKSQNTGGEILMFLGYVAAFLYSATNYKNVIEGTLRFAALSVVWTVVIIIFSNVR